MNIDTTLTTAALVAEYNVRATAAKLAPLATFKGSKAKLVARIEALPPVAAEPETIADFMRANGIKPEKGRALLRKSGYSAPYDPTSEKLRSIVMQLASKA